jgi:hypothetical protein
MVEHFRAKVRPELHPAAQELVAIYEAVPGALTYPGCCPEALAAVLTRLADASEAREKRAGPGSVQRCVDVTRKFAALLRGEQP